MAGNKAPPIRPPLPFRAPVDPAARVVALIVAVRELTSTIKVLVVGTAVMWLFVILAEIARFVGQ